MNTFSKCAFALVLVTATAIGLSETRSSAMSAREPSSDQTLGKVSTIAASTVTRSLSLTSPSSFSLKAAFNPVPNPAPSGTGGAGSR
ncbi:hypothetical protein [Phormidesmis priestleyi]